MFSFFLNLKKKTFKINFSYFFGEKEAKEQERLKKLKERYDTKRQICNVRDGDFDISPDNNRQV